MQKVEPEKPEIANDGNDLVNSESKVQEEVDQSTAQKTQESASPSPSTNDQKMTMN